MSTTNGTTNVAPIRTPMVDDAGNLTPPWQRYFSGQDQFVSSVIDGSGDGGDGGSEPPKNPSNVHQTVANRDDGFYTITPTWETPVPIGNTSRYEAQFRFYLDPTCATPETPWAGSNIVVGGDSTTLTTDLWPQVGGPRWVRTRVRGLNSDDAFSIWVEGPVGTGSLINAKPGAGGAALPDNVTIVSGDWEYSDTNTLKVRIYYTLNANTIGVHCWEEREDQSTTGGAPMDGSIPMNGTTNLGGEFSPIDRGYFAKSPLVLTLEKPPYPVVKRFYLASFNSDAERALIRATDPSPTPSIKLNIGTPTYQSGVEYARLITGPGVTVEYDDTQVSGSMYRFRFTWTAPTDPPTPWQQNFGGVQIVYEYSNGDRANGPAFAVNETTGKSDWYGVFVGTYIIRCWFVSYDSSDTPRLNKIIEGVTPVVPATVTWPLTGRDPAAPYSDNVTAFDVKNARYDTNGDGQKVLRIDAVWTQPTFGPSRARWGGVVIWLHFVTGERFQVSGAELGAGLTMEFPAMPKGTEVWTFYAVSQDNNGNPNTDGRSPIAGTPTDSITVAPPNGGLGTEYTSNVTLSPTNPFTVASVAASDGTTQQRITANFTKPADPTWGGVEMRVYDDQGKLMGVTISSVSPLSLDLPNPAYAMSAVVKLVSFDVNNKNNSEAANTPQGTVLIGSATGTFDLTKYLPSSSDLFTLTGTPPKITIAPQTITETQIKDNSISTPKLQANAVVTNILAADSVVAGKVAANAIASREIIAGSINSDRLNSTVINVGGGGSKPGKFAVFNASGLQIGFIGVESGNEGAWFKTIAVGSTSYANAPFKADNSGNVTINFPAANNSVNTILISQTTYNPIYSTAGVRIANGASPETGSDTTWLLSRGIVVYGSALNGQGNYYAITVNRSPTYANAGEVVLYGGGPNSYILLTGNDGRIRADGGYQVSSNVGVTGSYVFGTRTVTITGGIITAVT